MTNHNFVKVGEIEVERPRGIKPRGAAFGGPEAISVGVRTDTGELSVQVTRDGDRNYSLPPLDPDKARQLAEMLTRGADMTAGLREAYEAYRTALQQAEDTMRAAMAVHDHE
ncbi:hypothetical protein SEA_SCARLETT_64 [Mycobacterium phage Scarlett]|uniref:Uncharacterized protein n=1 Tax=Mycobacterium phage KiSi TaxID=2507856 RepID=A0A410TBT7_9CAUD|nr:hypothetical protein I5G98_gp044 [Mycobacterium phage KiSi]AYR01664.1 hypothetical protein SEA_SCARLETT_64 [Mycobacterium phage Scarlett]QAU06482.1 hypothetical protein SEA_KISI_64 [Mycobacterium phage KiSi]